MVFPGKEVRLTGQLWPVSSFLPFVKMGTVFPFFQSLGIIIIQIKMPCPDAASAIYLNAVFICNNLLPFWQNLSVAYLSAVHSDLSTAVPRDLSCRI